MAAKKSARVTGPAILICGAAAGKATPRYVKTFDEVWALNTCAKECGIKPDLVIAMDDLRRDHAADPAYCAKLFAGHKADVLTTVEYPEWPRAKAYPLAETIEALGVPLVLARHLFDNSTNYALALAITRGADHIGLHGVSFCFPDKPGGLEIYRTLDWAGTKYENAPDWFKYYGKYALSERRPREPGIEACHFLLGLAVERGIAVSFGPKTTLLNLDREPYAYGFEEQPEL